MKKILFPISISPVHLCKGVGLQFEHRMIFKVFFSILVFLGSQQNLKEKQINDIVLKMALQTAKSRPSLKH